ncbi:hypothetical protein ACLOJK_005521 [Asimina triloba]
MSSPIPLFLFLLPLTLLLSSSMINVCNARQLGLSLCKMKSSPAEIKMKQERSLRGEVTADRGACIEQKTDFAVNEVRGRTSDAAFSGAHKIRSLYTVSSGTTRDKAKEHESALEFHLDYLGPKTHPPIHN